MEKRLQIILAILNIGHQKKNDWIVEDVKSEATKTSTYRLKKKILEAQEPPVIITEI